MYQASDNDTMNFSEIHQQEIQEIMSTGPLMPIVPGGLVAQILMWPSTAIPELTSSQWWRPAVAVGATVFVMGVPSADMDMMSLAQWYVTMGGSMYLANTIPWYGTGDAESTY